jgi:cupin superfamily acireductone dioxygenase involved in methionine salvage
MHMNGRISTYDVMKLSKYDPNYANFICKFFLGHLRYGNLVLHIINGQNIISEVYSTSWGGYKFDNYYVINNTQRSF